MTPHSLQKLAEEIVAKCPEECFSNNSYREWKRSPGVLAFNIAEALRATRRKTLEEIANDAMKIFNDPTAAAYIRHLIDKESKCQ